MKRNQKARRTAYAGKDLFPPQAPCPTPTKAPFPSRKVAKHHLRRLAEKFDTSDARRMHVYRCEPGCGRWHIGHLHRAIQAGVLHRSDVEW